jgi:exosortase
MVLRSPKGVFVALCALSVAFLFAFWDVLVKLVNDWRTDDNYSHGFLVVPVALYFAWERRGRLRAAPIKPSLWGMLVVLGGVSLLVAGRLGAELFMTRVAIVVVTAGSIVYVFGWRHARILAFPLAFLLLMIPLPAIVFNQIAFPLQLLASRFGEWSLNALHIPVLREGNVIELADTTLEVAEACSGIRSLVSLLALAIVYGYFVHKSAWVRLALALATLPVAIAANGIRVAGTGVAAHYYGVQAAQGFLHTFSGWLVFAAAFAMLFLLHRLLAWLVPGSLIQPLEGAA